MDAYIEEAMPFARPILKKIRSLMHKACPAMEEELKWGAPAFMYEGFVVGMVAFKAYVRFGFWRVKELEDPDGLFVTDSTSFMNGERLTDVKELPPDKILIKYIKAAVALNTADKTAPSPPNANRWLCRMI